MWLEESNCQEERSIGFSELLQMIDRSAGRLMIAISFVGDVGSLVSWSADLLSIRIPGSMFGNRSSFCGFVLIVACRRSPRLLGPAVGVVVLKMEHLAEADRGVALVLKKRVEGDDTGGLFVCPCRV